MSTDVEGPTLIFDTIPDDPNNDLALQELRKIPGVKIRKFVLAPARFPRAGMVRFPLIREREGSYPSAQGLEEIGDFVAEFLRGDS